MLRIDEGVRGKPYNDLTGKPHRSPSGKLTIGVGRNLEDNGLSLEEINFILANDIKHCVTVCEGLVPNFNSLSIPRKMVFINLCFNIGATKLSAFKKTFSYIALGDWESAAQHLGWSLWAKQVPNRAARVIEMLKTNNDIYEKLPDPTFMPDGPGRPSSL